ncbi:efflux RND transporter periplasmic adaptor subunit [Phytopseudomonas dryadis]|uniref:Efflux transporter periplasmic adaptor subunit n=1 Tax=Phytopseudomonas dryadis TaxID=2487520 RepID=A0A4Q9R6Z3_9GAMM|nr:MULTISPECIES: efflux RND transporter periplasmic adaptor subunit [Pseudomonas]TBU95428.1 efflux transporter periplasmic adaptor subunit [Pseudomonas dryadis]TBV03831.1 efflux transporter periplasmic adaptor subunit [Pseudomonas dryadis]TBV19853.1 efflux transporter periplasmic adaptor subunit [Pseudomonas sp. FRB 230]
MRKAKLRYLIPAVVVLALGAYALKALFFTPADQSGLLTAEVQNADIEQSVVATGTLEAFKQVSVGAQVSGQIKTLNVDFGDQVKKGDLIAEIDSMTQQNNLANAKAALANVKAQLAAQQASLKQAQLAFKRQQSMFAQNASSRENFEVAEAELNSAKAQVAALEAQIQQAQIQVSTAEVDLGYTQITAPIDGTVVGVVVKEGQTVNSAQSAPTIVKLAQLEQMTVKAEISEADVVKVAPGMPVYFTILGEPDKRYNASLRMIEPAPDSINDSDSSSSSSSSTSTDTAVYYIGAFDTPNEDGKLRIAMTAQVNIVLAQARQVPSIPLSALGTVSRDGRYRVQVLGADGKVESRAIRTGVEDSVKAEVLEGLQVGERIVLGDAAAGSSTQMRRGPRMGF